MVDVNELAWAFKQLAKHDKDILTTRQIAILMRTYVEAEEQTIRGLSKDLEIPKSAVVRSVDKLENLHFVKRVPSWDDLRDVYVRTTPNGIVWIRDMKSVINKVPTEKTIKGILS